MQKHVWYWVKRSGKWFWALRSSKSLSRQIECGKRLAAGLNRIARHRLAAARARTRQLSRLASRLTKNIAGPVCSTIVTAAASAANAAYNLVYLAMPNRPAATSRKASHFRHRSLRFEQCEERRVLSASLAATPNPAVYGQPVTAIASLPPGTTGAVSLKDGTTVIGTATVQPASRPALQFDGTSGYVDLGSSNAFNFQANQAFSVSFWINSTDTNEPMIVGKGEGFLGHNAPGWSIFTYSGYLYFQLNAGVEFASDELQAWDLSTPICNGLWHHVTVTYDGSKTASGTRFYIDGVAQTLGTDSNDLWANAIHSNVDATIGATPAGSSYFSGELQQVLLFNTQISEAEDTALYNSGAGDYGAADLTDAPVADYEGDIVDGAAADSSGNGNDGTLIGRVTAATGPVAASSDAVATFTVSTLSAGTTPHSLTAVFSGDDSVSNTVSVTVGPEAPAIALTSSAGESVVGQSVNFAAALPSNLGGI